MDAGSVRSGDDGLAQGDKSGQQRDAADAQTQAHGGGVEQVAVGLIAVAGDFAGEVGVKAEVGDDLEPEEDVDGVVVVARVGGAEDAQHQRGEGEIDGAVEERQQDGGDAVFGEALHGGAVVFFAVDEPPRPHDGEEDEDHPGEEGDECAEFHAVGTVFEADGGAFFEEDAPEVARDARDGDFGFLIFLLCPDGRTKAFQPGK